MPLSHLVREPRGDPVGALILNHGRGTSEHDLFPLLDLLDPDQRLVGVAPGGPLTGVPPGGKHWYLVPRVGFPDPETFHRSLGLLSGFLDEFLAERDISWERTVIGGFSMGTVMSYAVALGEDRPSPAGIVALSGFVPTVEGWEPVLDGREGLPVFVHHGRLDPIIEVGFGRRAVELLREAALEVDYLETDAGHAVPPEAIERASRLVAAALPSP